MPPMALYYREITKKSEVFCSSHSNAFGHMKVFKENGKYVTAVPIELTSGRLAPVFSFVVGMKIFQEWLDTLDSE